MLDLRAILNPKKSKKVPMALPDQQGQIRQGTLDQQQTTNDPARSFQKRLKQNAPMSASWLGSAMRTGSQSKGSQSAAYGNAWRK